MSAPFNNYLLSVCDKQVTVQGSGVKGTYSLGWEIKDKKNCDLLSLPNIPHTPRHWAVWLTSQLGGPAIQSFPCLGILQAPRVGPKATVQVQMVPESLQEEMRLFMPGGSQGRRYPAMPPSKSNSLYTKNRVSQQGRIYEQLQVRRTD